jgi:type I restriction enzyme, S subunit
VTRECWQIKPLGEVLTFQRGFDITKDEQQDGPYLVYSSSGPKSTHSDFKVRGPGVIIGRKGSLGTVFFSPNDYWPHDTTLWVKDFYGNWPKFAYYFLQTMGFERLDAGASNPSLNRNHIHSIPVRWPSLPIQKRIAGILSAYDDLIENNQRRIKILEEMARSLYREWFVNFRFPGHEKVPLVDSPLGPIPNGWEVTPLGELAVIVTKGTTPTTLGKEFQTEGINFFKVESIGQEGGIEETKLAKIDSDTHELLKRSQLLAGDILFSIAGAIGRTTLVPKRVLPANTNQALAIIRIPDENKRNYISRCVRADNFQHFSLGRVVQTAQANVSLGILKSAPVIMPPKNLLGDFGAAASAWAEMQENLRTRNLCLRRMRDLLIPRLLSGQISLEPLG